MTSKQASQFSGVVPSQAVRPHPSPGAPTELTPRRPHPPTAQPVSARRTQPFGLKSDTVPFELAASLLATTSAPSALAETDLDTSLPALRDVLKREYEADVRTKTEGRNAVANTDACAFKSGKKDGWFGIVESLSAREIKHEKDRENVRTAAEIEPSASQQSLRMRFSNTGIVFGEATKKQSLPVIRSERSDLARLEEELDAFLVALSARGGAELSSRQALDRMLETAQLEQTLYDRFLDKIVKQVASQCKERGSLLAKVRALYANLFVELPRRATSLFSELEAQRLLSASLQKNLDMERAKSNELQIELEAQRLRAERANNELIEHTQDMARLSLDNAEAEKAFTEFRRIWREQREAMEREIAVLRQERAQLLANSLAGTEKPELALDSRLSQRPQSASNHRPSHQTIAEKDAEAAAAERPKSPNDSSGSAFSSAIDETKQSEAGAQAVGQSNSDDRRTSTQSMSAAMPSAAQPTSTASTAYASVASPSVTCTETPSRTGPAHASVQPLTSTVHTASTAASSSSPASSPLPLATPPSAPPSANTSVPRLPLPLLESQSQHSQPASIPVPVSATTPSLIPVPPAAAPAPVPVRGTPSTIAITAPTVVASSGQPPSPPPEPVTALSEPPHSALCSSFADATAQQPSIASEQMNTDIGGNKGREESTAAETTNEQGAKRDSEEKKPQREESGTDREKREGRSQEARAANEAEKAAAKSWLDIKQHGDTDEAESDAQYYGDKEFADALGLSSPRNRQPSTLTPRGAAPALSLPRTASTTPASAARAAQPANSVASGSALAGVPGGTTAEAVGVEDMPSTSQLPHPHPHPGAAGVLSVPPPLSSQSARATIATAAQQLKMARTVGAAQGVSRDAGTDRGLGSTQGSGASAGQGAEKQGGQQQAPNSVEVLESFMQTLDGKAPSPNAKQLPTGKRILQLMQRLHQYFDKLEKLPNKAADNDEAEVPGGVCKLLVDCRLLRMLKTLSRPPPSPTLFPVKWIVKWMHKVYDDKALADSVAEKAGEQPAALSVFVYDTQLARFGLQPIVDRKVWDIMSTLAKYRDGDREIDTFARFLEGSLPTEELASFLKIRKAVSSVVPSSEGVSGGAAEVGAARAEQAVRSLFAEGSEQQQRILNKLREQLGAANSGGGSNSCWPFSKELTQIATFNLSVPLLDLVHLAMGELQRAAAEKEQAAWLNQLCALVQQPDGWVDFAGFQRVFSLARPPLTEREVAQLYANAVRNAGTDRLSAAAFRKFAAQHVAGGLKLPTLVKHAVDTKRSIRVVIAHWSNFFPTVKTLFASLQQSDQEENRLILVNLMSTQAKLHKELAAPTSSTRLVSVYRALLHQILTHQGAWMLRTVEMEEVSLDQELTGLENVIATRHNLFCNRRVTQTEQDWMEMVAAEP